MKGLSLLISFVCLIACSDSDKGCTTAVQNGQETFIGCQTLEEFQTDTANMFLGDGVSGYDDYRFTKDCPRCK